MAENKKSGKGLIITLVIFMVAFATCAVLLFTGVVKSPMVKCEEKTVEKTSTKTDDDTKKEEKKEDSSTIKSADERYKEYISNLASSIKGNYVSDHEIVKTDYESYTKDKYNKQRFTGGQYNHGYSIAVKNNLDLVFNYMTTDDQIIAEDVVSFFVIHEGNGLYKTLYYITSNGKLHSTNLELYLFEGSDLKIEDLDYKNIVEIKQGSSTAAIPIFIDIDGNVIMK